VVLEAVRNNGFSFKHADDSLKADREVVLDAMKSTKDLDQVRNILNFASEELQNDLELKKLA
jgi:hypothetical protein